MTYKGWYAIKHNKPNQTKKQELKSRNGMINRCMDISNDKLVTIHMRRHEYGYKREILKKTEDLLIVAQNKVKRTNEVEAKIDKTK